MNIFISKIKQSQYTKKQFNQFCSKYLVKQYKIQSFSILKAEKSYFSYQRLYKSVQISQNNTIYEIKEYKVKKWYPNQLKLYIWTILHYCMINCVSIQILNYSDFQYLADLFPARNINFLVYTSKNLIKQANNAWSSDQIKILIQIMQKLSTQKQPWNNISLLLYLKSQNQHFRSPRKCRQFWFNHLNPKINKQEWTDAEDIILIKNIQIHGFRWSKIAKIVNTNRTEHMIKNRINAFIQKLRRGKKIYDSIALLKEYRNQLKQRKKKQKENIFTGGSNILEEQPNMSNNKNCLQSQQTKIQLQEQELRDEEIFVESDFSIKNCCYKSRIYTPQTLFQNQYQGEAFFENRQFQEQEERWIQNAYYKQEDGNIQNQQMEIQQYLNI